MEESLREMDDVIFGRIPYKWSYETKFHEAIIKAANNAILEYIYDVCNRMLYAPGKVASRTADGTDLVKARQEHQNVLNAIKSGNVDLAASYMQYHLDSAASVIRRNWNAMN